jgi:hypothetical protein
MVVKRIGPLSVAKNVAVLYAVLGIIIGAFFSLAAVAGAFADDSGVGAGVAGIIGVGAIVAFPIFYACLGFIGSRSTTSSRRWWAASNWTSNRGQGGGPKTRHDDPTY